MRASHLWSDVPPEKDGVRLVCYSMSFSPDGETVVAGIGSRVHVYKVRAGILMHTMKGHKDAVYATAYAFDGQRFATGGADRVVIVWSKEATGLLKYSHSTAVQCLAYNAITQQLASGAVDDLGLWHPEQSSVQKVKVHAKVVSAAWSPDGMVLATGHLDGVVVMRDKAGAETSRIVREAPVWGLCWSVDGPSGDLRLSIGDWSRSISMYARDGTLQADHAQPFCPNSLAALGGGEVLVTACSTKAVALVTPDGRKLSDLVADTAWVWAAAVWSPPRPETEPSLVAVGTESGQLSVYEVDAGLVHSLHRWRYAYREGLTTVMVRHLATGARLAIRCSSFVKKVSVFGDRLAVQLGDRVLVYDLGSDGGQGGAPAPQKKIAQIDRSMDCELMLVTSQHIVLCQGAKLQAYSFSDQLQREWVMDAPVKFVKAVGGKPGQEGLLLGLATGAVQHVFLNNPFPVDLAQHGGPVRCLDWSLNRTRLAVVDAEGKLATYDPRTRAASFLENGVSSACFNADCDGMLCYSTGTHLCVRSGGLAPVRVANQGMVIGCLGSRAFVLRQARLEALDLPLSALVQQHAEAGEWGAAYEVACLGMPPLAWRGLAESCLLAMETELARKCYQRLRDAKMLEVVARAERAYKQGEKPMVVKAECLASMGRFDRAAEAYKEAGALQMALQMFGDLRQFDHAHAFMEKHADAHPMAQQLVMKQADWSEQMRDFGAAAHMYVRAGKHDKAVQLLVRQRAWGDLFKISQGMEKDKHGELLEQCAKHFLRAKELQYARDTMMRLGDMKGVALVHVEMHQWGDAFQVMERYPELKEEVLLPYARWLSANDRFEEARVAYKRAGHPREAAAVLRALASNAIDEERHRDASYYLYSLSLERLEEVAVATGPEARRGLDAWSALYWESEVHYLYNLVASAETEPFRTVTADVLFNAARHLYMKLAAAGASKPAPRGVRLSRVLGCLARTAQELGAYKLARTALDKTNELRLPPAERERLDALAMHVRSKPLSDPEELVPICYRCGAVNPLLNPHGDFCSHCTAPFVRSYLTFEHLPLVEFELAPGVSDEEALRLLDEEPPPGNVLERARGGVAALGGDMGGREERGEDADTLRLDDGTADAREVVAGRLDPFTSQRDLGSPIVVDRDVLLALRRSEVLIRTWPTPGVPSQYFRSMDPDTPLCVGPCGHFFERDECELRALETGHLPFSRVALKGRSIPIDRVHQDSEWRGAAEGELPAEMGAGGGVGGAVGGGKGWRAVQSWQPDRPSTTVRAVAQAAMQQRDDEELAAMGVVG